MHIANSLNGIIPNLPDLLELRVKARRLHLAPRGKVLATRSGGHLSRFKGRGMEFDESRPYQAGDEVRYMDWRVTARAGTPHVKTFREERERPVWLLVDMGPSMRFGTRVAFKSVITAHIAALLAWAAADRGDRVGGLIFDEHRHFERRPAARTRGVLPLLHALTQTTDAAGTGGYQDLNKAAQYLQHLVHHGSLVFIISDFSSLALDHATWLAHLSKTSELVLVHVYDPIEKYAPPAGYYPVTNGIKYGVVNTSGKTGRELWQRSFTERLDLLETLTRDYQIHLLHISTADPLDDSLILGLRPQL